VTSVQTAAGAVLPKRRDYLRPWHGVLNVLHVIGNHALLLLWFWLGHRLLPLAAFLPLSLLFSLAHQRAMSEWIHEGAHYNLVPGRTWNDRWANLTAGLFFGVPVASYRAVHFAHHGKHDFFVEEDPDTYFLTVGTKREFRRGVLHDLTGLTLLSQFRRSRAADSTRGEQVWRALTVVLHAGLLTLAVWTGRIEAALVYYGSLAVAYPLLNRLRTYAQHVTIEPTGQSRVAGSATSRTVDAGLLDRLILDSARLLYHHEHHQYPHLPYRALKQLVTDTDDINAYSRSRTAVLRAVYRGLPDTAVPAPAPSTVAVR
jgi:fatty acid desaturase